MKKLLICTIVTLCTLLAYITVGQAADKPTISVTVDDIREIATEITEYETEIKMLAKLMYSEARGINSKTEQAAVAWCVLNRVDTGRGTIAEVITAKSQFAYSRRTPVKDDLRDLAEDVLMRWLLEQKGIEDVGRVLPKEYTYFAGRRGHNWFRTGYQSRSYWDWSLESPYES